MCYLVAKNKNAHGCYALKTRHGSHLVEMKRKMNQQVAAKGIQLVTISRPTAYGEYAPYTFVEDENEFEELVQKMAVMGQSDYKQQKKTLSEPEYIADYYGEG